MMKTILRRDRTKRLHSDGERHDEHRASADRCKRVHRRYASRHEVIEMISVSTAHNDGATADRLRHMMRQENRPPRLCWRRGGVIDIKMESPPSPDEEITMRACKQRVLDPKFSDRV